MNTYKKRILIDLDGVLNEYGKEKYDENFIPEIKIGAVEFLEKISKLGELYLFTTRNHILATKWLISNKIDFYFKDITNIKIPAFVHIDDRAVCFKGDYEKIIEDVIEFKVYWKNNDFN